MGVYKNGENWFIDYYAMGKRRREKIGSSRALAANVLMKRKLAVAENKFLDVKRQEKIRFEDFADTFIELHSKLNKKPASLRRDIGLIKNLNGFFAGKYLYEITPVLIEKYRSMRVREVSPSTVNREVACLKCIFNKGIKWGKAEKNPVRDVKLLKENNRVLRYLEKDEISRLIDNCAGHLRPIVIAAVFTGMRKSEVLNLMWKDVDLTRGLIRLHDTKNGESREVYLTNTVLSALREQKQKTEGRYVFPSESGSPYADLKRCFRTALKRSGITDFRFHDLRHTFASQLVMSGIDLNTVRELMGHKSIEMTLRYAHLSPDHKRRAVEVLDKKINIDKSPTDNTGLVAADK